MGEEFERAKSYLQVADEKGVTLYDHVAELILKLIKEKPDPDTGACTDRQTDRRTDSDDCRVTTQTAPLWNECAERCALCF